MPLTADGKRRKSERCFSNPSCVWVALVTDKVELSDSADGGRVLRFESREWGAFIAGVKNGEFDWPR
ncbi:DUF397 domain-containing protein [Paractinoplanes durhamensis]|uniref:DUF397 domain-containing protein n=2 Tax=Paractinoplanes durhamensis TaxID=113563 RepID=A0ABQ3YTL9_9ACTN|nr:DUF397 domain-containing protein [Actinoplanes durhamensis]GIE00834.1 hypothetical protein Adu01nite_21840 [Actinoplanes durhamensis]